MTTAYVTAEDQIVAYDPGEHTLEDNFNRFHAENPHVYETLVKLARRWQRRAPGQRCGIKMLFEVARWYLNLRGEGEPFALNNNYHAFYARAIMEQESDLEGLFEVRRQRGLDGGNPVPAEGFPPSSPRGSTSGGAGGLAAASAARTAEAPAPSEDGDDGSTHWPPSSPDVAAAGTPKHTPPAAATLFDLPNEPDWA